MKSARFAISLIALITCAVAGGAATAGGPCDEAQAIRRERIAFDAEMRRRRVELRHQALELERQEVELDERMAAILEEILRAAADRVEALWLDLEEVSKQRDALWSKIDEFKEAAARASRERMDGKGERKARQLGKQLECVINEPLSAKLSKIGQVLQEERGADPDAQAFATLVQQRAAALESLRQESARFQQAIGELQQGRRALGERIDELSRQEDAADAERDQRQEAIDVAFEQWGDALERAKGQVAELSKKIMPFVERLTTTPHPDPLP